MIFYSILLFFIPVYNFARSLGVPPDDYAAISFPSGPVFTAPSYPDKVHPCSLFKEVICGKYKNLNKITKI